MIIRNFEYFDFWVSGQGLVPYKPEKSARLWIYKIINLLTVVEDFKFVEQASCILPLFDENGTNKF